MGYIYCELLDDNNQGRKYFQELVDNYPDDELVKIINLIVDNTGGTSLKKNSAKNINIQVPDKFELLGNYPNPFNPSTTISYTLPYQSSVELVIYDIIGRIVKSFNVSSQSAGYQSIVWDGRNGIGNSVASGIYLYKLSTGNFTQTKKMILMR